MSSLQGKYDHATELAARQPPVVKLAYLVNELGAWAKANPGKLQILHSEFAGLLREMREQAQAAGDEHELELYPSSQFRNNAARLDLGERLIRAIGLAAHGETTRITDEGKRVATIVPAEGGA